MSSSKQPYEKRATAATQEWPSHVIAISLGEGKANNDLVWHTIQPFGSSGNDSLIKGHAEE